MRDWLQERFGDRAVNVWAGSATPDGGLDSRWDSGDGVHQNDEVHRIIFERVRDAGVLDTILVPPRLI
ncbi:MAG: hypothetical protein HKN04_15105 [Rhodothermaceae bacterium]|nr:hypothetical protein [Rhodothermaceae bacterium]